MKTLQETRARLESLTQRSAWNKGVTEYALELLEALEGDIEQGYNLDAFDNKTLLKKALLNGAQSWHDYSYGGCSLIYDEDIAERLCTPTELKRTRNGERNPNSAETWLDVQSRALYQACNRIMRCAR